MCLSPSNGSAQAQSKAGNFAGYIANVIGAGSGNQASANRLAAFRSQFQAAHGGMTAQQLYQARNAMGGQPSTTGG